MSRAKLAFEVAQRAYLQREHGAYAAALAAYDAGERADLVAALRRAGFNRGAPLVMESARAHSYHSGRRHYSLNILALQFWLYQCV